MDENDDTEFKAFYSEIEKRTSHMDDYEDYEGQPTTETFTIKDGNGNEYIYVVELDGYLHGVVLEKIDKAKRTASILAQVKGGNNGKSATKIVGSTRSSGAKYRGKNPGNSGAGSSVGAAGNGRLGGGSPQSNLAGTDDGNWPSNKEIHDQQLDNAYMAAYIAQ